MSFVKILYHGSEKKESDIIVKKIEMKQIYLRESTFDDCRFFAEWETQPAVTRFFTINDGRDYEEVVTEFVHRKTTTSCS